MTIDPKVKEALLNHDRAVVAYATRTAREVTGPFLADCDKTRDALLSAVRTAHLQELAGETDEETLEEAVEAVGQLWTEMAHRGVHAGRTERETVKELAPILTAPLRAKLQAQEARIKTLEGELKLAAREIADNAARNNTAAFAALDRLFGGGK